MNGTLAEPTSATKAMQNAINRSRQLDPTLTRTTRVRAGVYRVEGQHDDYLVTVTRDGYACTCEAGRNDRPACWHRASAYRRRIAERSMRAAVAPKAARVAVSTTARDSIWGAGSTL